MKLVAQRLEAMLAERPALRFALDVAFYVFAATLVCRVVLALGDAA